MLASVSLWQREIVRFFRQKNRVMSSVATPLVFWLLLGFGLKNNFQLADSDALGEGQNYLTYFYPGTITLVLLFTAIFSTISVIEDKQEGFMQGVLVAPAPRLAIVLGKVLGGATIATAQGLLFMLFWPLIAPWPGIGMMLGAFAVMLMLALSMTALGMCFAWRCNSTAGFHAVMNLLLMPMWFLSGSMFPIDSAPIGLKVVMLANPLTYGQELLAGLMTGDLHTGPMPFGLMLGMSLGMMIVLILFCTRMVNKPA